MPPPMEPPAARYRANSQDQDDGEGWDDDWDDDASSYSGGDGQTSSMRERSATGSSIQRTGTMRKSMNRYISP